MEIKINGKKSNLIVKQINIEEIKNYLNKKLEYGEFVDSKYLSDILKLDYAPSYIRDLLTKNCPKNFIVTKQKKIFFASEKTISDYLKNM